MLKISREELRRIQARHDPPDSIALPVHLVPPDGTETTPTAPMVHIQGQNRHLAFLFMVLVGSAAIMIAGEHILIVQNADITSAGWVRTGPPDFTLRRWVHALSIIPMLGLLVWCDVRYRPRLNWRMIIMRVGQSLWHFAFLFFCFAAIDSEIPAWAQAVIISGYAGSAAGLLYVLLLYLGILGRV